MITDVEVRNALKQVQDPELGRSIVDLGMVRDLKVEDDQVVFTLALTNLSCPFKDRIVSNAKQAVQALQGVKAVDIYLDEMTEEEKGSLREDNNTLKSTAEKLNNIKHVIAIMSGKGGVGKSLVTGLLATGLCHLGNRVGVLDADITGPSKPELMAFQLGMPFLGCLPIDPSIAALCDSGEIENYPGDLFGPIAKKIAELTPVAVPPKTKKHEPSSV